MTAGHGESDSLVLECVVCASMVEIVTETGNKKRKHFKAAQQVRHLAGLQCKRTCTKRILLYVFLGYFSNVEAIS